MSLDRHRRSPAAKSCRISSTTTARIRRAVDGESGEPLLCRTTGGTATRNLLGCDTPRRTPQWPSSKAPARNLLSPEAGLGVVASSATRNLRLSEAADMYGDATTRYGRALRADENESETKVGDAELLRIYRDLESREVDVFFTINARAADETDAEEEGNNDPNRRLAVVLGAATELADEFDALVKDRRAAMPQDGVPRRAVNLAFAVAVAHVCSLQILQAVGGRDGHTLPDLMVECLTDVVVWVENFWAKVEETFPGLIKDAAGNSAKDSLDYEVTLPRLLEFEADEERGASEQDAVDALLFLNGILWEVHRLALDEFLFRTRMETEKWLGKAYDGADECPIFQTSDGRLFTSLPEDICSLLDVQLRTICGRLSRRTSYVPATVATVVLSMLRTRQIGFSRGHGDGGGSFLQELEGCCAAANDFARMGEECEEIAAAIEREFCDDGQAAVALEAASSELVATYTADAVRAARSVHLHVFRSIRDAIGSDLFGPEWEDQLTHNELALTLTATLEDYLSDLEQWLDGFALKKAVDALVSSSVLFYVECLLTRAREVHNRKARKPWFQDNARALRRISDDINVMRRFFEGIVPQMPALQRIVDEEFETLTAMLEILRIAAGLSPNGASEYIVTLHKRIRNVEVTRLVVEDLWRLVSPQDEKAASETVQKLGSKLQTVASSPEIQARKGQDISHVPGLHLDEMLIEKYLCGDRSLVSRHPKMVKFTGKAKNTINTVQNEVKGTFSGTVNAIDKVWNENAINTAQNEVKGILKGTAKALDNGTAKAIDKVRHIPLVEKIPLVGRPRGGGRDH